MTKLLHIHLMYVDFIPPRDLKSICIFFKRTFDPIRALIIWLWTTWFALGLGNLVNIVGGWQNNCTTIVGRLLTWYGFFLSFHPGDSCLEQDLHHSHLGFLLSLNRYPNFHKDVCLCTISQWIRNLDSSFSSFIFRFSLMIVLAAT